MDRKLSKKQRKQQKLKQKLREQQQQAKAKKQKQVKQQKQHKKAKLNDNNVQAQNSTRKKSKDIQNVNQKPTKNQKPSHINQKPNKKQKKTKKKDTSQSQQNQENDNNEEQDLDFNNVLQGEDNLNFSFLIAEINEKHYHSMKTILEKYSRITGVMSSEWADAIIGNAKIGNTVVTDDADDSQQQEDQQQSEEQQVDQLQVQDQNVCSGVINILPSSHQLANKVISKIQEVASNKQPKFHGKTKPSQVLKNACSLLICERAINMPPDIVKCMHEVLVQDLKQLQKQNKKLYSAAISKYIVAVSQIQLPKGVARQNASVEQLIYSKYQDYLFLKNSQCWWIGEGSPNAVRKVPLQKLYFVISAQKYFEAVGQINSILCQSQ